MITNDHVRFLVIEDAEKRATEETVLEKLSPMVREIQVRMFRGNLEVFVHSVAYGVEKHAVDQAIINCVQSLGFKFLKKEMNVFTFEPLVDLAFVEAFLAKEGLLEETD